MKKRVLLIILLLISVSLLCETAYAKRVTVTIIVDTNGKSLCRTFGDIYYINPHSGSYVKVGSVYRGGSLTTKIPDGRLTLHAVWGGCDMCTWTGYASYNIKSYRTYKIKLTECRPWF